jgi:stearoyl-CoA desaturase (delta-9 desaturase)
MQRTNTIDLTQKSRFSVPGLSFIILHLLPLGALFTGATLFDWIVCAVLYITRMFWVTGGYHRYFSHKTYKTSRWFQFLIAFFSQTSVQKGALWWASHHRIHHRHSDTEQDPHSMKLFGFWYSHMGWIASKKHKNTEYKIIGDYAKYPELVWLNKYHLIPPVVLALLVMALGGIVNGSGIADMFTSAGLSTLFVGFFLSTIFLFHGTFSINSLMHKIGKQRYKSGDESRNSFILALVTLGEGWHNNHHYYQASARQGFFWWEIDITYYGLKMMSWLGLIWELRGVPDKVKHPELAKRVA